MKCEFGNGCFKLTFSGAMEENIEFQFIITERKYSTLKS